MEFARRVGAYAKRVEELEDRITQLEDMLGIGEDICLVRTAPPTLTAMEALGRQHLPETSRRHQHRQPLRPALQRTSGEQHAESQEYPRLHPYHAFAGSRAGLTP